MVGDDGGGALLINPAAMARRDTTRTELGGAAVEDTAEWQRATDGVPLSVARAGSRVAPFGAAIVALGDWIVGVGAMTAAVVARSLPHPNGVAGDTADKLGQAYDYRYTGIAGSFRRDMVALGAAHRLGDSLALGASLGASRIAATEERRIWSSHAGREVKTDQSDVDLAMSGTDPLVASAVLGVLYAPGDAPIEIGASLGWTRTVQLDGSVTAAGIALGPEATTSAPHASLRLNQPLAVRAGGRYVGDRLVAELDGDLWIAPSGSAAAAWQLRGVHVGDGADPAGPGAELERLPSRISQHTHFALRSAIDFAVVPGFLWITGGYAFATGATPDDQLSPSLGDLGGHTLGLGLEATAASVTVTLGWSRTWSPGIGARSRLLVDSPFVGGNGPVPRGTYYGSNDQAGVLVEVELGGR
ncbi:MAG TPA: hypothetical protein VK601_30415 [Kofleriaceae bacterium]|nr:hypothetical protein [Kofleriaceae bacterium]